MERSIYDHIPGSSGEGVVYLCDPCTGLDAFDIAETALVSLHKHYLQV